MFDYAAWFVLFAAVVSVVCVCVCVCVCRMCVCVCVCVLLFAAVVFQALVNMIALRRIYLFCLVRLPSPLPETLSQKTV